MDSVEIAQSRVHHQRNSRHRKPQLPSYRRVNNPPPFQLTVRDQQIILRVYYFRLLTSSQIEALLFHTTRKARGLQTQCQRRLQLLYHHQFLNRVQQAVILGEGRKPFIYVLDKYGVDVVGELLSSPKSELTWTAKHKQQTDPYRLEHDIGCNDIWVILDRLVQSRDVYMPHWLTQQHLKSIELKQKLPSVSANGIVRQKQPDGYFALRFSGQNALAHFFYEEDRGTQSQKQWSEKIQAYMNYRHSGAAQTHFGFRNFRVLIKTTSARRLANIKQWSDKYGGATIFWLTSVDRVSIWQPKVFLEPIWEVAGTNGTYPLNLTDASYMTLDN
ncbi:MAG: replication-relaxation family protein [Caldilineaceae bacterium]